MPSSSKPGSLLADAAWRDLENVVQWGDLRGFQRICCLLESGGPDPSSGWGPLEHAVFHNKPDMVAWWIAEYGKRHPQWVATPLVRHAIRGRSCASILAMLHAAGCSLADRDEQGKSLLHQAAWLGDEAAALFLLQAGHEVSCKDRSGWSALRWAIRGSHYGVVQLLLRFGADPYLICQHGMTDADFAVMSGNEAMETLFRPFVEHRLLCRELPEENRGDVAVRRL